VLHAVDPGGMEVRVAVSARHATIVSIVPIGHASRFSPPGVRFGAWQPMYPPRPPAVMPQPRPGGAPLPGELDEPRVIEAPPEPGQESQGLSQDLSQGLSQSPSQVAPQAAVPPSTTGRNPPAGATPDIPPARRSAAFTLPRTPIPRPRPAIDSAEQPKPVQAPPAAAAAAPPAKPAEEKPAARPDAKPAAPLPPAQALDL
jgi:hypothetical protein